jgi:hypothetical protein
MGMVEPPRHGLGSNSNYLLASDCQNLRGVSVAIEIAEDLVSNIGFGFQLNAYSPKPPSHLKPPTHPRPKHPRCAWQQYLLTFKRPVVAKSPAPPWPLFGVAELWREETSGLKNVTNDPVELMSRSDGKLPAGCRLSIALEADGEDSISGVTFTYTDSSYVRTSFIDLTGDDIAPIVAFEVDLVGPDDRLQSLLWSGAGTITYKATNELQVLREVPTCAEARSVGTAETANSVYAEMPATTSHTLTQRFWSVLPPPYVPGGALAVSQQFGANQTDVFMIDRDGQLAVFHVEPDEQWKVKTGIGPPGLARSGAPLAASRRFGVGPEQTDVFVISQGGQLAVFSVVGTGPWSGPVLVDKAKLVGTEKPHEGAPLAVGQRFGIEQTDVYLVDGNGQLKVFSADQNGDWSEPVDIGPRHFTRPSAHVAMAQQPPNGRTDVFVIDSQGGLNVFWIEGYGVSWNGPEPLSGPDFAPPGAPLVACEMPASETVNVFVVDNEGCLYRYEAGPPTGRWAAEAIGDPLVGGLPAGAPLDVSPQFGTKWTNVFVVDTKGRMCVAAADNIGPWIPPQPISDVSVVSAGAALVASRQFGAEQTDVFVVNETGARAPGWPTVFSIGSAGEWHGPSALA